MGIVIEAIGLLYVLERLYSEDKGDLKISTEALKKVGEMLTCNSKKIAEIKTHLQSSIHALNDINMSTIEQLLFNTSESSIEVVKENKFSCPGCNKSFSTKQKCNQHISRTKCGSIEIA